MTSIETKLQNEQTILRTELQELKKCQIQYFLISIGATGAIFGFSKDLLDAVEKGSLLYLSPLMIILPCWLTFFDKANTITRLTGYVRVFIEEQLREKDPDYFGYESSLSKFREIESRKTRKKKGINKENNDGGADSTTSVLDITRNQYWKISWLTFLFLSLTCFLYPYFKFNNFSFLNDQFRQFVYLIFVLAESICVFLATRILWRLLFGKYSYERVTKFWRKVFREMKNETGK